VSSAPTRLLILPIRPLVEEHDTDALSETVDDFEEIRKILQDVLRSDTYSYFFCISSARIRRISQQIFGSHEWEK